MGGWSNSIYLYYKNHRSQRCCFAAGGGGILGAVAGLVGIQAKAGVSADRSKSATQSTGSVASEDARHQAQTSQQIAQAQERVKQWGNSTTDSTSKFMAQQVSSELGKALASSQALEQSYARSAKAATGQQDSVGVKTQFSAGAEQMAFKAMAAAGFSAPEAREALVRASNGEAPTDARAALALQIAQNAANPMAAGQVAGMESLGMTSLQGPTSAAQLDTQGKGAVDSANQANRGLVRSSPRGGGDSGLPAGATQRFGAGVDAPVGGGGANAAL